MAEDADPDSKTEDPSARRLTEAAQQGNIAKSQEISHWFIFLAATIALWMFSGLMWRKLVGETLVFFEQPELIPIDPSHLARIAVDLFMGMGLAVSPIIGLFMVFSLSGSILQNPPRFTPERLQPNLEKLNPLAGLKRMVSLMTVVEFVKNLIKIAVIGVILFALIWPELDSLEALIDLDVTLLVPITMRIIAKMLGALLGIMFVIAVADYLYQKYNYLKQLRMTKQEVKDEHKETEGDPMIKARLRQIRMQRSRKRMMKAVPEASVVVTNPTHYAVALKYDPDKMDAPRVVAKGADLIARRIREIATEHKVPIVENPPLARALFKVEIDDPIPFELYRTVAEVISYIMRLKQGLNAQYEPDKEPVPEGADVLPGPARGVH
jgi:flagellar biosynthetic protein FlhB